MSEDSKKADFMARMMQVPGQSISGAYITAQHEGESLKETVQHEKTVITGQLPKDNPNLKEKLQKKYFNKSKKLLGDKEKPQSQGL